MSTILPVKQKNKLLEKNFKRQYKITIWKFGMSECNFVLGTLGFKDHKNNRKDNILLNHNSINDWCE